MLHIFQEVAIAIHLILEQCQHEGIFNPDAPIYAAEVTAPKDRQFGEMTTNAAMILHKHSTLGNPRALAELLVLRLQALPHSRNVTIAGPGFINLTFAPEFWHRLLPDILDEKHHFGTSTIGNGIQVNVEYVSANPTGPMHIGHTRGAVVGDCLANVLKKAGYHVTREYYVNDAGAQIIKLLDSAYIRYLQALDAHKTEPEIPDGLYPGDYLVPVGETLANQFGETLKTMDEQTRRATIRPIVLDAMLTLIREDLAAMGVKHDLFRHESDIAREGLIEQTLASLEAKDLLYEGVLEPPKGKAADDWEPRPQLLFRATSFGDDTDRALKKSDGSWTYFTPDIAYHYDKLQRGFHHIINIFGADHAGYVKRLQAAVAAMSDGHATIDILLCQLVKFMRDGQPVKMSKRAGNFITARDVLDEVGKDALRFIMLTRKNDAPLDFDYTKVLDQSKENPVFYVQYAHARVHSLLRIAEQEAPGALALLAQTSAIPYDLLTHDAELALMQQLALWPRTVEQAAQHHEPHRIAFYAIEIAAQLHEFWNLGNQNVALRFIVKDNMQLTAARLAFARAIAWVIASALEVLGVTPLEELRS